MSKSKNSRGFNKFIKDYLFDLHFGFSVSNGFYIVILKVLESEYNLTIDYKFLYHKIYELEKCVINEIENRYNNNIEQMNKGEFILFVGKLYFLLID